MSESALRSLEVLEHLANADAPQTAGEVSRQLGLSRATVSRLLNSLAEAGWIIGDGRPRRFGPALRLATIASSALKHSRPREMLRPWLLELAERTGSNSFLCLYERGRVIGTDAAVFEHGRLVLRSIGEAYPVLCTAPGRILLAFQPEDEVRTIVEEGDANCSPVAKMSRDEILEEIRLARERGYATTDREYRSNSSGLAVPVFRSPEMPAGAFSVAKGGGLTEEFLEKTLPIAQGIASRASLSLGYSDSPAPLA